MASISERRTSDERQLREGFIERLRQHARDVCRLTRGLDDAALERRTVPDKWSIAELTCHLWRVQQLFEGRLDAMLASNEPAFESYAPENDPDFPVLVRSRRGSDAVRVWLEAREGFVSRLESLKPDEWRRTGRHPTFSRFDVEFLIEYMVHHEAHHLYQIFQRRMPLSAVAR